MRIYIFLFGVEVQLLREDSKGIYDLLLDSEKKKKIRVRGELLRNLGVSEEYFDEGTIKIDALTCRGAECKLCVKACPTNALYWTNGKIKIEGDLCIYCGACVLSCCVDNCIKITRKRKDGIVENFSTPREAIQLMSHRATLLREETLKLLLAELLKAKSDNT